MRIWITTFGLLFILMQIYQWIQGFMLPLPIYVLGGAFLAIASNYEKGLGVLLKQTHQTPDAKIGSRENSRE